MSKSDEYMRDNYERGLVKEATPGQREEVELGEGDLYSVDLGGGSVVVFKGPFQVLRRVDRCQHCGQVGGH